MSTAFQQTILNQQHVAPGANGIPNANSLINAGKGNAKGALSFAQEFAKVKELIGNERDGFNPKLTNADIEQVIPNDSAKKHLSPNIAAMLQNATGSEAESKLKSLRDEELTKEIKKVQDAEDNLKTAEEINHKYHSSETTKANVSQENHKIITNAVKEGNVAEQEKRHYEGDNSRKRQLANWEELAPKITEDSMNKAVRIDIPGLNDVETIIVRMNRDAVSIQAVGSKEAMERLHLNQSELVRKLQDKNVKLASLQVFDGNIVREMAARKGK